MRRVIELEGCLNFRDVGGYPTADGRTVRWRQLYRSDALHRLSAQDVDRLCGELGLTEVIDLRSTAERRSDGAGLLGDQGVRFHHVPLFDGERMTVDEAASTITLADRYLLLAEFARERLGRILGTLADASGPAVYHCAAGKDRTGVVSAVLLGCLGVPDEVIVVDYAASRENLDAIVERLLGSRGYRTMLAALPPDTLHAEPETMVAFLEGIRTRYGSLRQYALGAGVGEDALARLSARLLE